MDGQLPLRKDVKKEDTWNLEDYYKTEEDWMAECDRLEQMMAEYDKYRGHMMENAQILYECLKFDDDLMEILDRAYTYASQKSDEDTSEGRNLENLGKMTGIFTKMKEKSSFINVEVAEADWNDLEKYMNELPALAHYRRVFEQIHEARKFTLSEAEEKILAAAGNVTSAASDVFRMVNNADIKFEPAVDSNGEQHVITHGNYVRLLSSRDRVLRKSAFEQMFAAYGSMRNTLAALYNANLKKHSFYARVRGYEGPLQYSLFSNNIPTSVYDCLLECIHDWMPSMYRYVALRKKMLGVDDLSMYDVYAPIVDAPDMKFTFEEAKEIVITALAPMGEEYQNLIRTAYENRWIDVYENQGKRAGAYSTCAYGVHPYMLLNFNGSLDAVFTLAHEMGHSLHSYYSNSNQSFTYAGYKIFVAEVASTCNEALLSHFLIDHAKNDAEKAYIINHFLDSFKGTIFRQTMFGEFEKITHEMVWNEETLTADKICDIYLKLNKLYFGPEMNCDDNIAMEWARIPHFYRPFYVYQYATGFTAAIALCNRILALGDKGVADYKKFLKGGCSLDPIDLLKVAGVDMSTRAPFDSALREFDGLISQLEAMIVK